MQKVTVESLRGHIISEDIEDVEYVEISDQESTSTRPDHDRKENPPKYDEKARSKEVYDYAEEQASKCDNGDPRAHFFILILIIAGVEWSDMHPVSSFCSEKSRVAAFVKFIEEMYNDRKEAGLDKSDHIHLLYILNMTMGYKWATANPPKYY